MRRIRNSRGATVVEYALGVALILVVCLVGIRAAERSSGSKLSSAGAIGGNPDAAQGLGGAPSTTATTSPGSTTTTVPGTKTVHLSGAVPGTTVTHPKWNATITFTVLDSNGQPVAGVVIAGSWSQGGQDPGCTTNSSGQCFVDDTGLQQSRTTDVFTISGMSPGANGPAGVVWDTSSDNPPGGAITVNQPAGCC